MAKWVKYLFASIGWAAGGVIGALIGFAIGSVFDLADTSSAEPNPNSRHRYANTGTQQDFDMALMVLVTAVLKADGVVRRSELDYVKRFLLHNYGEERGKQLLQVIHGLTEQDIPVQQVCRQIKVNTDYSTRYQMYDFLFGIAGADGEFTTSELTLMYRIGIGLGISKRDYQSCLERHVGSGAGSYGQQSGSYSGSSTSTSYGKDPYKVLGIESSASDDEIRRAYRRMAMKYHPDRVADMGEEIQRNAADQMKEINAAYEELKRRRNIN